MKNSRAKEVAQKLGVGLRQARRLIAKNHPRLHPVNEEYIKERARERLSWECHRQVIAIRQLTHELMYAPDTGCYQEGPEIDALYVICGRLTEIAQDLRKVGVAFDPKPQEQ